jgi:enamine deaminase RidA (YjgF/YER057c/UK114 family)
MSTRRFNTSNPYETKFGYSRAVRTGPFIFISGTTSIDPTSGTVQHPTSAYLQSITIFEEIIRAVEALGATKDDVVRVRMFVTDTADTDAVWSALKEVFGAVGPAASMIVGARFVEEDMKVEIEADAVSFA